MKEKFIFFLVLIAFFLGFILVKFFFVNQKEVYGQLKVTSSPTTGIFLDNVAIGKTPFEDKLKVGEYLLKLIPEGNATDTASWQGKINIYKNTLTFVNRELGSSDVTSAGEIFTAVKMKKKPSNPNYGEIAVETDPNGAIVYLDNDEKGVAPVILADVLKGDHELSVFMPGFFRRTQKINVDPGYQVIAKFKLAIDQSQKITPTPSLNNQEGTESAKLEKGYVIIKDTGLGFLRVREEPSLNASESARIKPGGKYQLLDEQKGWYKIKYNNDEKGLVSGSFEEGWISGQYAAKE
ncbi:MAG: PEGA domain-containing protein [Microgenomates group bacterium]|nr:PEGA domain-containing protein [Microgenomates group bacterium]